MVDISYKMMFYQPLEAGYSVGKISKEQFENLVDAVHDAVIDENTCPCVHRVIGFELKGYYGFNTLRKGGTDFDSMDVFVHNLNGRSEKSPCEYDQKHRHFPLRACVENFTTGKCKCPYMTSVFGANILPELYQKQK